jgi:hypothetical protein
MMDNEEYHEDRDYNEIVDSTETFYYYFKQEDEPIEKPDNKNAKTLQRHGLYYRPHPVKRIIRKRQIYHNKDQI